jgi:hypothetical protein
MIRVVHSGSRIRNTDTIEVYKCTVYTVLHTVLLSMVPVTMYLTDKKGQANIIFALH